MVSQDGQQPETRAGARLRTATSQQGGRYTAASNHQYKLRDAIITRLHIIRVLAKGGCRGEQPRVERAAHEPARCGCITSGVVAEGAPEGGGSGGGGANPELDGVKLY